MFVNERDRIFMSAPVIPKTVPLATVSRPEPVKVPPLHVPEPVRVMASDPPSVPLRSATVVSMTAWPVAKLTVPPSIVIELRLDKLAGSLNVTVPPVKVSCDVKLNVPVTVLVPPLKLTVPVPFNVALDNVKVPPPNRSMDPPAVV